MAMASVISLTIGSSSTIIPSHPTPNHTLSLSESDQMMFEGHVFSFYVYKASNNKNASPFCMNCLKNSLSQILVPYYPLAGRLHRTPNARVELHCCTAGAEFIEAETSSKLEDYADFKSCDPIITNQLVPSVDYTAPIEEQPVCVVQVTRFGCGGVVLGFAISHFVMDGTGYSTFINSWASIARGEKTMDTITPKPYHERDLLQPRKPLNNNNSSPCFHHHGYPDPPLLIGQSNDDEERNRKTTVASLKLSKLQVEKLKQRANNQEDLNPNSRPYTTFEVVAAHIWVSACKARKTCESEQPTMALIPMDLRRRIKPPLPEGFSGNAILFTETTSCKFGDLMEKPLSYVAGKIRETTWKVTDEYIKSTMESLASKLDYEWIKELHENGGYSEKAPFWGNPNVELGCLTSLPFHDVDFGWGRPCHVDFAFLDRLADGSFFITSDSDEDGFLLVLSSMQTRHMDDFNYFFYQHL